MVGEGRFSPAKKQASQIKYLYPMVWEGLAPPAKKTNSANKIFLSHGMGVAYSPVTTKNSRENKISTVFLLL